MSTNQEVGGRGWRVKKKVDKKCKLLKVIFNDFRFWPFKKVDILVNFTSLKFCMNPLV